MPTETNPTPHDIVYGLVENFGSLGEMVILRMGVVFILNNEIAHLDQYDKLAYLQNLERNEVDRYNNLLGFVKRILVQLVNAGQIMKNGETNPTYSVVDRSKLN